MTMMRALAPACLLVACAGARASMRDPHEHELAITVHNESGAAICSVHIFPIHETERGASKLPPEMRIKHGESLDFYVPKNDPAKTYQVEAGSCSEDKRQVSGYAPSIFMNGPALVVLFDEGDPKSKEAAQSLAHTNDNTTVVPAKYTRKAR